MISSSLAEQPGGWSQHRAKNNDGEKSCHGCQPSLRKKNHAMARPSWPREKKNMPWPAWLAEITNCHGMIFFRRKIPLREILCFACFACSVCPSTCAPVECSLGSQGGGGALHTQDACIRSVATRAVFPVEMRAADRWHRTRACAGLHAL